MGAPLPIQLASLGMADSLILMVLALVVFGPRRLPQIGRQIGKLMFEFRKASNDFKFQMEEELRLAEEADRRKKEEEERQRAAAMVAATQASVSAPSPSIEAQADIGAVEPATAFSSEAEAQAAEVYPPATSALEPDSVYHIPHLQPPRIGEQVSGSAPFTAVAAVEDAAELNYEADVEANADSVEAMAAANGQSGATPGGTASAGDASSASAAAVEPSTSSKEPVSQHG
jgi:sec-independent protein translocase protein TatB